MQKTTPSPDRADARQRHIVVVGGGITGLTAAYRVQEHFRGHASPARITLIERNERVGGKIGTEVADGFTLEHGPDIFLARKPAAVELCRELGLADRLIPTNPAQRGSLIHKDGVLHPLPEGLSAMIPTRLRPLFATDLLSPWAKLRVLFDFVLPARSGKGDESVAAFVSRRMGREVFEQIVDPLLGGIYGGTGEKLSLQATFPQLHALERTHGSLIRGLLAQGKSTADAPAFLSLKDGMAELPNALAARLDRAELRTDQQIIALEQHPNGYRLVTDADALEADAVILTAPAYESARLLRGMDTALADDLLAIPYGSTAVLWMAFPREAVPHPLDAYGYLIPRSEKRPVLACTWTSTKLPSRVPDDMILIRVFFGRADAEAILGREDAELLGMARDEMRLALGIEAEPVLHRLIRWPAAMPQYVLGHPERIGRIEARTAQLPGLQLAGAAYRGVGIPDCISDAGRAAEATASYLASLPV